MNVIIWIFYSYIVKHTINIFILYLQSFIEVFNDFDVLIDFYFSIVKIFLRYVKSFNFKLYKNIIKTFCQY